MCKRLFTTIIICSLCACNLIVSNDDVPSGQNGSMNAPGFLSLKFLLPALSPSTKGPDTTVQIDTNSFHLTVAASDGEIIYDGAYGDAPEHLNVEGGSYHIKVESAEFTSPGFDKPRWGDETVVTVPQGSGVLVELQCRQLDCGVRMKVDSGFLAEYPSSCLLLSSSYGKLLYSYSEKRTAYFLPGAISLVMSTSDKDETLMTRVLAEGEILCLDIRTGLQDKDRTGSNVNIQIDTSCTYIPETVYLDGGVSGGGNSPEHAFTIAQAKENVGCKGVWVGGYIVGGDLSSKSMSFTPPFSSATNLAIGPRSATSTRTSCLSIQLPSGNIREGLNLVSNPENLGRFVLLKGDIEASYFGLVGLKNVSEYSFR